MDWDSIPILPGFYAIRERLTDDECRLFMNAMLEFRQHKDCLSDDIIKGINPDMQGTILKYRANMYRFLLDHKFWGPIR